MLISYRSYVATNCIPKDLCDKLDEFFLNNKMSWMLQYSQHQERCFPHYYFFYSLKNLVGALADCDSKNNEVELVMQILR